jgi:hypothetical protein
LDAMQEIPGEFTMFGIFRLVDLHWRLVAPPGISPHTPCCLPMFKY